MSKTFKIPANPSQEGGGLHSAQHQTVSIISPSPPAAEENLQTHQSCPSYSIPNFTENSCGPVKQTVHNSAVQLHLVTLRIIHEKQQTAQAIRDKLVDFFVAVDFRGTTIETQHLPVCSSTSACR